MLVFFKFMYMSSLDGCLRITKSLQFSLDSRESFIRFK